MNRKSIYWGIGIAAVVIIAIAVFMVNNHNHSVSEPGDGAQAYEGTGHPHSVGETDTNTEAQGTEEIFSETVENQELAAYIKEQDQIMSDMMEDMQNIERTNNASIDFINGMIPHHESAVAMSQSLLSYGGRHQEIRRLAEDIIKAQNTEIEEMRSLAEELAKEAGDENGEDYLKEYDRMFSNSHAHHMDLSGAQSVDEAFARGMAAHHQMAVDMAKSILNYTESDRLREMAQHMVDVQEKEIAQLNRILSEMESGTDVTVEGNAQTDSIS